MKFSASLALIVIVGLIASGSAMPAKKKLVYFQQPAARYYAAPQRMMYVQYVQPSRPFARSTQAAEAFVAGDTVGTGTYLQEADISAAGPAADVATVEHGEDILSEAAYPAAGNEVPAFAGVPTEVDIVAEENEVAVDAAKTGRDYNFEAAAAEESAVENEQAEAEHSAAGQSAVEQTAVEQTAVEQSVVQHAVVEQAGAAEAVENAEAAEAADALSAPAPFAPVAKPVSRYLPSKNKVYVELDQSVESQEETAVAVAEEEEEYVPAVVPARRPVANKPAKAAAASASKAQKPLPAGTFFPINFGGTSGGAIAIANSFSTGEGGSATSHAIAYGSPDSVRARARPSKHH